MTTEPNHHDPTFPPAFEAGLAAYSSQQQARSWRAPVGFAERVSERHLAHVRFVRRAKWATTTAVVALTVGIGGYFATRDTHPPIVNTVPQPIVSEPPMPKLGDSLSEAGEALASLSRDTTERVSAPTRSLVESVERFRVPTAEPVGDLTSTTQSFAAMPNAAKSGLEPMANNTRRAISLFLRDTGLQSSN